MTSEDVKARARWWLQRFAETVPSTTTPTLTTALIRDLLVAVIQESCIPEGWIKRYVDQLLELAGKFEPGGVMREATLSRADHAMELVKAWRESSTSGQAIEHQLSREIVK